MDVGSTIINLVFDHDEDAAFLQLEDRWGKMFEVESLGSVLSLYASGSWQLLRKQNTDPVGIAPCLMLTFNSPTFPNYKVCVITMAFPTLPITVRGRILDASVEEAINSSSNAVVVGGFFHSPFLWLDNRVWKLKLDIDISIISDLYVLPWCATGTLNCTALDAQGPFTLVIDHVQSSAERPASSSPSSVRHDLASSAVLPAPKATTSPSSPQLRLKPHTPLYDQFLADLEAGNDDAEVSSLLDHTKLFCFHGELCYIDGYGEHFDRPMPLSLKMEELLRVVTDKRRDIVAAAGLSEESLSHHHATPTEMQDIMNNWRNDVSSWMSTDNQNQYWELKRRRSQKAHQFAKSRFTTYCHHISGCRFLLSKFIELPILRVGSAERPA